MNVRRIQGNIEQIEILLDDVKPEIFLAVEHGLSMDKICSIKFHNYVLLHGFGRAEIKLGGVPYTSMYVIQFLSVLMFKNNPE